MNMFAGSAFKHFIAHQSVLTWWFMDFWGYVWWLLMYWKSSVTEIM